MEAHLSACKAAIVSKNGSRLADLLSLPVDANRNGLYDLAENAELVKRSGQSNLSGMCSNSLRNERLGTMVYQRVQTLSSMAASSWQGAVEGALAMYNTILEALRDEDSAWLLPVLVRVSNDVRLLAVMADGHTAGDEFIRKALEHLTKGFTMVAKEKAAVNAPGSKKWALFAVTNVLFKIYFKVNTLQLCGKLINVIEMGGAVMSNLSFFPVSDVVTYYYYVGRLKLFEDKYVEARDCLLTALRRIPVDNPRCHRNRQRIMASLAAVQMALGVLPTPILASKYGLAPLYDLGQAVKRGDLRTFDAILTTHQQSFLKIGIYLLLEQVKVIAYRCLLKKMYLITGNNTARLNLITVTSVVNWLQSTPSTPAPGLLGDPMNDDDSSLMAVDVDEVECIVANLIYTQKVKGYISHQKSLLVLSKQDPFPIAAVVFPVQPTAGASAAAGAKGGATVFQGFGKN